MCTFFNARSIRTDASEISKLDTADDDGVAEITVTEGIPILSWNGVDDHPSYFSNRSKNEHGKLGIQIEVTMPTSSWPEKANMGVIGQVVPAIVASIKEKLEKNGLHADVRTNQCKCFVPSEDKQTHTLPVLILVYGISSYVKFGEKQLSSVTEGLFSQLSTGLKFNETDYAIGPNGNEIKSLEDILNENQQLKGGVRYVTLQKLGTGFGHLRFSDFQILLELEVIKQELIENTISEMTGGVMKSQFAARIASNLGQGKSSDIVAQLFGQLSTEVVENCAQAGINVIISGPALAAKAFSNIGALSKGASVALHTPAWRSVIPYEFSTDSSGLVILPKKNGFEGGIVPPEIEFWGGDETDEDFNARTSTYGRPFTGKHKYVGFRLVLTVSSVNPSFEDKQLTILRNGIVSKVKTALVDNLRKYAFFGLSVDITSCGWQPGEERMAPFPHDMVPCAKNAPNWEDKSPYPYHGSQ